MIQSSFVEGASGQEVYIAAQNGYKILISQTHAQVEGRFRSKTLTAPGTIIVAEPDIDGCIVLTDLILTSDKTQSSSITVQFTDDVETIVLAEADMTDAPVNIATSFAGYWRGWRNARLELVVTGGIDPTATLAAGYFKLHDSMLFGEWDSLR